MGQDEDALSHLYRVLELEPQNVDAILLIGIINMRHEKYSESISYFEKALKISQYEGNRNRTGYDFLLFRQMFY